MARLEKPRPAYLRGVKALSETQLQTLISAAPELVPMSSLAAQQGCNSQHELIAIRLTADEDIGSTEEAYLKLHLLSHRLALPNTLNLNGIFAHLPNLAWTSAGPIEVSELPEALMNARAQGLNLEVLSIDKFPKNGQLRGTGWGSYR